MNLLTIFIYRAKKERLTGDVLLATGFLSYAGAFNQEFRVRLLNNWKKKMEEQKISYSDVCAIKIKFTSNVF